MGLLNVLPNADYLRDILLLALISATVATLLSIRFYLRITAGRCFTEVNAYSFSSYLLPLAPQRPPVTS